MVTQTLEEIIKCHTGEKILINETNETDSIVSGQIIKLTQHQITELETAHEAIYEFQRFYRKFKEVELNLADYYGTLAFYEKQQEQCLVSQRVAYQKASYINVNRVFSNFLTSFNSLIYDYLISYWLPKLYGKKSRELKDFIAKTNDWFDNKTSYRIIVLLRDFSVHYDLPIFTLSYNIDIQNSLPKAECIPKFSKDHLLKNGKFRRKIGNYIDGYNLLFPVKYILDEVQKNLQYTIKFFLKTSKGKYKKSAESILNYKNKFDSPKSISFGEVTKKAEIDTKVLEYKLSEEILQYES